MTDKNPAIGSLLLVFLIVVVIREGFVWLMTVLGYPATGSLVGMLFLLALLLGYRALKPLPRWLERGSSMLLTESALAYLPVCAAGGMLLFTQFGSLYGVMFVTVLVTLVTLKGFGVLARRAMPPNQAEAISESALPSETGIDIDSSEHTRNQNDPFSQQPQERNS
jgi:putative effector of murein hydrolase LrgA (UPF0299 family)